MAKSEDQKRERRFAVRLTRAEYLRLMELESSSGISRSELLRAAVSSIDLSARSLPKELLDSLDALGTELSRSGNNINQLAHHVNSLNRGGQLAPHFIGPLTELLKRHVALQRQTALSLRAIIRAMAKGSGP